MNREDIIRMAREADFGDGIVEFIGVQKFERFAALVAKHTLSNIDPSSFMTWQEGYEAGKQTERDACIDLVAMYGGPVDLEAAIRARGNVATNDTSQERVDKTSEIVHEAQRTWVGLTPQERDEINEQVYGAVPHHVAFHAAIEAKLKEKNSA